MHEIAALKAAASCPGVFMYRPELEPRSKRYSHDIDEKREIPPGFCMAAILSLLIAVMRGNYPIATVV